MSSDTSDHSHHWLVPASPPYVAVCRGCAEVREFKPSHEGYYGRHLATLQQLTREEKALVREERYRQTLREAYATELIKDKR